MLELLPGGSQLTAELVRRARSYVGVSPSLAVIGVCRHLYAGAGTFVHGDIRELEQFQPGEFGAVAAWRCAIDLLDDEQRRLLLAGVRRVLAADGGFIFSSHNLAGRSPEPELERRPGRAGGGLLRALRPRSGRALRPRSGRAPMDEGDLGHALLSGIDGELEAGRYHIERDAQQRQLEELDFRLLECLDLSGTAVPAGDLAADSPELHYAAQPAPVKPPVV